MINAIIVDDENSAIITLKNDLTTYCPMVKVMNGFTKASEAIVFLEHNNVDVIFLDIDMPIMNGFDFLQALDKPILNQIIFVTAYSEFAVRAFKVSALDYLLKPIDPTELINAVQKISNKKEFDQNMLINNFINNYYTGAPKEKLALPVNDGYHLIDPKDIIYCKADGSYTEIIMENEKSLLVSKTLGKIQELMPVALFERVHQSYLINLNHIKKFKKGESPSVMMTNNDAVKVSRLRKDKLATKLGLKGA